MTLKEISQKQKHIYQLLDDGRVYEAILSLSTAVEEVADYSLTEHFNTAKVSYDYLLQYLIAGVKDEGRDEMLSKIIESLYKITDKCVISLSAKQSYELFYTKSSVLQNDSVESLVSKYLELQNKYQLLSAVPLELQNTRAISGISREMEDVGVDIFNKVWCTFPLSNSDAASLKHLFESAPVYINQLILSALFIGQTKFYDEAKLVCLLESYVLASDVETQTRALTGAFMTMLLHPQRVKHSNVVKTLFAEAAEKPHFRSDMSSIMQRLVRSRNTENVSKRMREELMPNIMKMDPGLISKLKGKQAIDPSELEENPQWQEWLDKSGVSKKMEELNKLQTEGEDVFISTFSQLKSFPFFNVMANWFLPFYPTHSSFTDSFPGESRKMLSVIKFAPFLCDSDKYSFCFSLASVPEVQKKAMMSQMDMHNADLKELESTQLPDDKKKNRDAEINGYIQCLYRFFNLFSRRNDFLSVFKTSMDFTQLPFFEIFGLDKSTFIIIAEYYLKNGFFKEALSYFQFIQNHFGEVNPQFFQKMGFAYQNLGEFKKAIECYQKYEFVDDADLWNIRHLAMCFRSLKNYDKALEYYEKALSIKSNNANLCLNAGHCLLELNRPDEAMNYYFKADYLDSSNPKVWRSLAWASYLVKNYDQSERYYQKLIDDNFATDQDYLNFGHLLLTRGELDKAVNFYALSASGGDEKYNAFLSAYCADIPVLLQKGVDPDLVVLLRDAVVKKLNNC